MKRSPRNRTLSLTDADRERLAPQLTPLPDPLPDAAPLPDRVFHHDGPDLLRRLPPGSVDLLLADPPYNLSKHFNGTLFRRRPVEAYAEWLETWLAPARCCLKPEASLYVCSDWFGSLSLAPVLARHYTLRNRITWEREKGRSAAANWKNASEDIWFATVGPRYTFNADAVKSRRRVIAPYRVNGQPKDWSEEADGNFRLTGASNLWTDLSVPFWSMPENTDHPTQKPEKLVARLILASTRPGDLVCDPFLGSGTTAVVCKKLGRRFIGAETEREYVLLALKRLEQTRPGDPVQGYHDGVFRERNAR